MKKDISEIDHNLKLNTSLNEEDIIFYNVKNAPFDLYGLIYDNNNPRFRRMNSTVANSIDRNGIGYLNYCTAGGRVRFTTSSRYIAIKADMPGICHMSHMALSGSAGFDLYINTENKSTYSKTFMPPTENNENGYESIIYFEDERERHITINFPLYSCVNELYIGLDKNSTLSSGLKYRNIKPVVYYGSSITQGGCASRPGNAYQSIISRKLNIDHVNLGFSGSARAEDEIIDYLKKQDMSVFVCDYDHNAPTVEHLASTHLKLYQQVRENQPHLPIIFISKPDFNQNLKEDILRRDVVYSTYMKAINNGDKNVYFIDGHSLFGSEFRDCATVDGCHPNDYGFVKMAEIIGSFIERIIK